MGYNIKKNNEGRYQVIKDNAKRATRVFDSYEDAVSFVNKNGGLKQAEIIKNEKNKKGFNGFKLIVCLILGLSLGVFAGFTLYEKLNPGLVFEIVGDNEQTLRIGTEYEEDGFIAKYNNKDISSYVDIVFQDEKGNEIKEINSSIASKYSVLYILDYPEKDINKTLIRIVNISNEAFSNENLSVHFLELGNKYTGDSVYIKAGEVDILIDAGSRKSSSETICQYLDSYIDDGTLEYVIATHAHQDHIAGFVGTNEIPGIFDVYKCEIIIDFPLHNTTSQIYKDYSELVEKEVNEGAIHYTALECYNNLNGAQRKYQLAEGISLEILYNYYYENKTDDENDYSVCVLLNDSENNYLFTGDLEKKGEEYLVEYNKLPKCKVYKAGHHGSKTSSSEKLLEVIKPEIVCVCCCAGTDEYTDIKDNQFPTQDFIDRVSKYTDQIFVTSLGSDNKDGFESFNGNIVISFKNGVFNVNCSNNNIILKDTIWFKENRKWIE